MRVYRYAQKPSEFQQRKTSFRTRLRASRAAAVSKPAKAFASAGYFFNELCYLSKRYFKKQGSPSPHLQGLDAENDNRAISDANHYRVVPTGVPTDAPLWRIA